MIRLPSWVIFVAGLAVIAAQPFTSGVLALAMSFLAAAVLLVVYLRGRRDVDEIREARDVLADAWHRACAQLEAIRKGARR